MLVRGRRVMVLGMVVVGISVNVPGRHLGRYRNDCGNEQQRQHTAHRVSL
jgi:hypothetical protein